MRLSNGVSELDPNGNHTLRLHRLSRNDLSEGCAFNILHGNKIRAFDFADLVNGRDARMVQVGGSACFPQESFFPFGVRCNFRTDQLDRRAPPELRIFRQKYFSHCADPKAPQQPVM